MVRLEKIWEYKGWSPWHGGKGRVTISNNNRIIGSFYNKLTYLDIDGNLLWEYPLKRRFYGIDISKNGECVVACNSNKNLYCLDNNGNLLWKYKLDGRGNVKISSDNIVASCLKKNIYYFNQNGQLLWKKQIGDNIVGLAFSRDLELIIAGLINGQKLVFFDIKGQLLGESQIKLPWEINIAASNNSIIVRSFFDNTIYRLGLNGKIQWKYKPEKRRSQFIEGIYVSDSNDKILIAINNNPFRGSIFQCINFDKDLLWMNTNKENIEWFVVNDDFKHIIIHNGFKIRCYYVDI